MHLSRYINNCRNYSTIFSNNFGFFTFLRYTHTTDSGCSAVGSAPRLGRGGPRFESAHPDRNRKCPKFRVQSIIKENFHIRSFINNVIIEKTCFVNLFFIRLTAGLGSLSFPNLYRFNNSIHVHYPVNNTLPIDIR